KALSQTRKSGAVESLDCVVPLNLLSEAGKDGSLMLNRTVGCFLKGFDKQFMVNSKGQLPWFIRFLRFKRIGYFYIHTSVKLAT
ncbi:MAG TPA: hypothetical protein VIX20_04085, partial [Ktedonobacteraceae bacterium]